MESLLDEEEAIVVGVPTESLVVEEFGCSARPK